MCVPARATEHRVSHRSRTWSAPVTSRPPALAAAVVLVVIIGSGIAFVGVLLLTVAVGGVGFLGPTNSMSGVVAGLGALAVLAAALALVSAVGLWLRRPWGWVGSLATALAAVVGAVIALDTSGSHVPVQAGLVLTVAAAALLLAPSTRSAARIG
jgi:hypothetical protein